jgi:hypothetical protein
LKIDIFCAVNSNIYIGIKQNLLCLVGGTAPLVPPLFAGLFVPSAARLFVTLSLRGYLYGHLWDQGKRLADVQSSEHGGHQKRYFVLDLQLKGTAEPFGRKK